MYIVVLSFYCPPLLFSFFAPVILSTADHIYTQLPFTIDLSAALLVNADFAQMYFDPSPASRSQRQPLPSPCSISPGTTSTTTLLPFRRRNHAVDVAAALSPVQAYLQPQWATEPLWAASNLAAVAPRPSSPLPPQPTTRQFRQQQQVQPQLYSQPGGAWPAAMTAVSPHAYYLGENFDSPATQSYRRSPPYREDAAGTDPPAGVAAAATVSPLLPRQPFTTSPLGAEAIAAVVQRDSLEKKKRDRVVNGGPSTNSPLRATAAGAGAGASSAASRPRGRGITEVRSGCTTSTERVRYRNNVTKKLIDLYDEVAELYECRENMNFQVTQAMRSDPRYTKERHGEVRLAYKPTPSQQAAITAVDVALEALHDACHELVAAYLTPEEKRYLGIDTHLFQTQAEKKSTYQYAPASSDTKSKAQKPLDSQPQQHEGSVNTSRSSSPSSSSASGEHQHHHHHRNGSSKGALRRGDAHDAAEQATTKFTVQSTSLPSSAQPLQQPPHTPTPCQEERTATTVLAGSPSSPLNRNDTNRSYNSNAVMESSPIGSPPAAVSAAAKYNDPEPRNTNNINNNTPASSLSPPPPPSLWPANTQASQPSSAAAQDEQSYQFHEAAETEDTVAVGSVHSPERMFAPAGSASSLGGGAWPSDTASTTVRASPVVAGPPRTTMLAKMPVTTSASGGSMTVRGPQRQLLVKVPVQSPSAAASENNRTASPVSKWPPGIPAGAKLVRVLPGRSAQPTPNTVATTTTAVTASNAVASALAGAQPSSQPPSHPPSRTNSTTNRMTGTAPKAPTTRPEFQKFLIDSDSDSTMA